MRKVIKTVDGVIRGHRLTNQESRNAMFPEAPIWTDIGLLEPIENMKLLGILDMIEKMLLADAYYHPLDTNDIHYENGFELTKEEE